ncbi:hypothetical protein VTK56DRAFT_4851 [Thermocarpiscus australiensis]
MILLALAFWRAIIGCRRPTGPQHMAGRKAWKRDIVSQISHMLRSGGAAAANYKATEGWAKRIIGIAT